MNIDHLRYLVEIVNQGSIFRAAQALYVSQPSLSTAIRNLEEELKITLFHRSNKGSLLTREGESVYRYARTILEQVDNIKSVSQSPEQSSFRLVTKSYSYVMEAFVAMCAEYNRDEKLDFSIRTEDLMGVIDGVACCRYDLGILVINNQSLALCDSILSSNHMESFRITEMPVNVNISKKHPLLSVSPFPFEKLNNYMFVKYESEKTNSISYMPELSSLKIINPNKTITVTDRELKCNVVSQTTAFSIGCKLHPRFMSKFDIVAIPIPGNFATLSYIKLKNSYLTKESKRFLEILRRELDSSNG